MKLTVTLCVLCLILLEVYCYVATHTGYHNPESAAKAVESDVAPPFNFKNYSLFWRYSDSFNLNVTKSMSNFISRHKDSAMYYNGKAAAYYEMEHDFK